jgi:prolipoprotein diacylglyceryltransferase
MLWIEKKWPSIGRYKGTMLSIFLIGYGIERFVVDFYRYYESQMYIVFGLDFNQLISLSMVLVGVIIILVQKRHLKSVNN